MQVPEKHITSMRCGSQSESSKFKRSKKFIIEIKDTILQTVERILKALGFCEALGRTPLLNYNSSVSKYNVRNYRKEENAGEWESLHIERINQS